MNPVRTIATLLVCLLAAAPVALADKLGADRARALVLARRIMPLEDILRRNAELLDGRLIELELEQSHDRYTYQLRLLGRDGHVRKLKIDAVTGAPISAK